VGTAFGVFARGATFFAVDQVTFRICLHRGVLHGGTFTATVSRPTAQEASCYLTAQCGPPLRCVGNTLGDGRTNKDDRDDEVGKGIRHGGPWWGCSLLCLD
jgi:hypothetical protein